MDAKAAAGGGEKAVATPDAAPSTPPRATVAGEEEAVGGQQRSAPSFPGDSAGADGAVANAESGASVGEDEQQAAVEMERFYALLANIRAMRGMYRTSGDGASADSYTTGGNVGGGGERKRVRRADQPWRPVFRMEDFADSAGSGGATTSRSARADDDGARLPPPVKQPADEEGNDDRRGT